MTAEMRYNMEGFNKLNSPESNLHEVEERAILDQGQEISIQQIILAEGGTYLNKEIIDDIYFCPSDVISNEDMEALGLDKEIIRLRLVKTTESDGQENTETILTQKHMSNGDYGDWVETNNPREGDHLKEETKNLQTKYGLKPFFVLSKTRTNWQLEDTTLSFDVVPDFGTVLEAEKITTAEQTPQVKIDLQETVKRLGVRPEQKPKTSITSQLRRRYASF